MTVKYARRLLTFLKDENLLDKFEGNIKYTFTDEDNFAFGLEIVHTLNHAFEWDLTPEGHYFWSDISSMVDIHDLHPRDYDPNVECLTIKEFREESVTTITSPPKPIRYNPSLLSCMKEKGVLTKFIRNCKNHCGGRYISDLTCSFVFSETPEGYDFWAEVSYGLPSLDIFLDEELISIGEFRRRNREE